MRSAYVVPTLVAIAAALAIGAATAPADTRAAQAPEITAAGVGQVRLGRTFRSLRAAGQLGRVRGGCELGGPDTRSARLRSPLRGSVDLSRSSPRRVRTITVTGGASARGVGVGSPRAAIRAAFPGVRFDRSTEPVFGITLATVPRSNGGRLQFGVDTSTNRVTFIGIPFLAFCE